MMAACTPTIVDRKQSVKKLVNIVLDRAEKAEHEGRNRSADLSLH